MTSSLVPTSSQLVPDEPVGPRPLVPSYRDEDEGRTPKPNPHPVPRDEVDDWQERLAAAVAETIRRRQARRDQRAQLQARRDAGLNARHTTKLDRRSSN